MKFCVQQLGHVESVSDVPARSLIQFGAVAGRDPEVCKYFCHFFILLCLEICLILDQKPPTAVNGETRGQPGKMFLTVSIGEDCEYGGFGLLYESDSMHHYLNCI